MARVDDGFSTRYGFDLDPSVEFWVKTVTPPSIEAGGENDTTTMHNTTWRTKAPKKLKSLGTSTLTAAYDPACYDSLLAMIGVNQLITITFADDSTYEFWGWIDAFTPGEIVEGAQPTATVTVIASNQDDSAVPVETDPVYTAPPT